jgi:hypothetical protein
MLINRRRARGLTGSIFRHPLGHFPFAFSLRLVPLRGRDTYGGG